MKLGSNCSISKLASISERNVTIGENGNVTGNFAIEHSKFIQFIKSIR